ncbi:MAG: SUMF1/EgtB/PvdO family nonheme iron enzyme [Verrucomicrobiaceae bacterium]|nr:SUMF1/EgtB/PvdO family nonheme iron enzyme [Verrucomicrobiaceae bacterium]
MSDSPDQPLSCPQCGAALPAEATEGLCPRCLLSQAMRPPEEESAKPKKSGVPLPEELAPHFPNYEILRILGRGGMGAVYLARQTSLNRLVAIKILPAELDDGENNFTQRFKNEAQAMAQLSHPGIVAVYDFGQTTSGLLFIVMEYIDGTDVALMVTRQGRLPSAHAMAITAHVCDALAYAHGKGIIHRDIKPSNIMIGNDGVVKVADFGLAKMSQAASSGLTQSGMVMGTLHFMAPEALMLGSEVDQRADIYAVGVMLYQMLTGKLPQGLFEMPSLQVKGLDPRYDQIVAKALREDRNLRYPDANAMRHDLDAILTQPVVKAEAAPAQAPAAALPPVAHMVMRRPAPRQMPPAPPPRRSSVGTWATLFILGSLAAWFFLGQPKPSSDAEVKTSGAPTASQPVKTEAAPPSATFAASLQAATKEAPFVNSLGMKFVPVPIAGGPTDGQRVLFSVWETRVQDYEAFAKETKRVWPKPDFEQGSTHPAVNMTWEDSHAFCQWLTEHERKAGRLGANETYRLPSDHEWSCAVAIGGQEDRMKTPEEKSEKIIDVFPWGRQWPRLTAFGNYAGEELRSALAAGQYSFVRSESLEGCNDPFVHSAPVGSFDPNSLGLCDLGGNAWEWCGDWSNNDQKDRVVRGASWLSNFRDHLLSSRRFCYAPMYRSYNGGFRCVIEIAIPVPGAAVVLPATQATPFVNSLGMKFVPVPITGGPTDKKRVLFSVWVTRVRDFEAFAKAVSLPVPVNRKSLEAGPDGKLSWDVRGRHWQGPGFPQTPDHPVVTVSWEEANAFCEWLTQKERSEKTLPANHRYRLPSDHEWSCAAGIGELEDPAEEPAAKNQKVADLFSWGTAWPPPPGSGNFAGIETSEKLGDTSFLTDYRDDYPWTSPVDAFAPGKFGLHDMCGNVTQWCADLFTAGKGLRVLRGAGWDYDRRTSLLLSTRASLNPGAWTTMGFRVVLAEDEPAVSQPVLPAPKPASMIGASAATKGKPFENSLGMKFVPVPITGGPTDGQRVLFSIWETRVKDYEVFAKEKQLTRTAPPYSELPDHPVVNVSFNDATAYCSWLTDRERKAGWLGTDEVYRLPSDHEWSCAVGIGHLEDASKPASEKHLGIVGVFPWGSGFPPPAGAGNYNGEEESERTFSHSFKPLKGYRDNFPAMAPVGQFNPNGLGLYDLGGNAWEWCLDIPLNNTVVPVMRGATFLNSPERELFSSMRGLAPAPTTISKDKSFRVVLATSKKTPTEPPAARSSDPTTNTLGMKFAPLPGTKVFMCIHETRRADYTAFASAVPSASPAWKSTATADNHPVTNVSWEDAVAFCSWLSKKENRRYRLPTDREWSIAVGIAAQESAAAPPFKLNGGVAGVYPWSKAKLATVKAGNYAGAGDVYEQTAPVMSFPANDLGFFDLGGNVWEYCSDLFSPSATTRVLRGASWMDSDPAALLSSCRDPIDPAARSPFVGFRCVLDGSTL